MTSIARLLAFGSFAFSLAAAAQSMVGACDKNHYILAEPCALQWTPVNEGLADLDIRSVMADPVRSSTLYAGGLATLFKSTDGGDRWSATGLAIETLHMSGFPGTTGNFTFDSFVSHIAIDPVNPDTIYAATVRGSGCIWFQRRVFKSVDGGANWIDPVGPAMNGCDNVHSLVLAPSDPRTVYLASYDDATGDTPAPFLRSNDGGETWTGPGYQYFNVLAVDLVDADTVYGGTFAPWWFPDSPSGVLVSRDRGNSWSQTGLAGTGISAIAMDPTDRSTLYAAAFGSGVGTSERVFQGIFKTTDGGETWAAVNEGLADLLGTESLVTTIALDPGSHNIYLAMGPSGVFRSADAGATWAPLGAGLEGVAVRSIALVPGDPITLYAATSKGVFRIADAP